MIARGDLRRLARDRLKDASALIRGKRYDGAFYLCGYAVEVALKARICQTLKWAGFPETRREFQDFSTFRTHDLDLLLSLSGIDARIKAQFLPEWLIVVAWNPEIRYRASGSLTQQEAEVMLVSARKLVTVLC